MSNDADIATARRAWTDAKRTGLASELRAYLDLLRHPDVTWRDLISTVERVDIVGEQAWLRFRSEFKELEPAGAVRQDQAFWQRVLEERNLGLDDPCRMKPRSALKSAS